MTDYSFPMSEGERAARADLRAAHDRLAEITAKLRIPHDTFTEIHALARKIESASARCYAEFSWAHRMENERIAAGIAPACDSCGNSGEPMGCPRCGKAGGA